MSELDLQAKFPNMTPIKSAPILQRVNGCGVSLYGRRDRDADTGAYVSTWCISLLFVPVVALRAYRVAPAPGGGWYFLGREPLSNFARQWNRLLLAALLSGIVYAGYVGYTSTPSYKARSQMSQAKSLVSKGRAGQAAKIYEDLALAGAEESQNARNALQGLVDQQAAQPISPETVRVFNSAARIALRTHAISGAELTEKALKLVQEKGTLQIQPALGVLDAVRLLNVDTRPVDSQRLVLLRQWAAAEPANLDAVVPLASILEQQNQLTEARKLLLPVKDRLGDGEGARVLGTILGREQDYDGAYSLLWPYVTARLDKLHAAEKSAEVTERRLVDREVDLLSNNEAPSAFYEKYKTASEDAKRGMVRQYINERLKADPEFTAAQENLERETPVVPVALDLGIIMLQRAQAQQDAALRKAQLEATEKVFLAISGVAGQTDAYRLSLGQIYYWLGKQAEGRALFEEFLTAKNRSFEALLSIGEKMRQLGADPDARAMIEEAFQKAAKPEEKYEAAGLRSVCQIDNDDEIAWLNKCNTSEPAVKARLAAALGDKAFEEGRDADAIRQYQTAVEAYTSMPRSITTLNQSALAYGSLFRVSGQHRDLEQCLNSFQQAVDLQPENSVLLYNAGVMLLSASLTEIISSDVDLHALHEWGGVERLSYLYSDKATRAAVVQRTKEHPGVARALAYLNKAMVVSPKHARAYAAAFPIYRFTRNESALVDLERRIKAAGIDTTDELARTLDFVRGAKDQQSQAKVTAALKRSEKQCGILRAKGGTTAAVALDEQMKHLLALDYFTGQTDAEKVVALAEEAARLSPSEATRHELWSAYLFRADKDLCRRDPAFAAWHKQYYRSLGTGYLLALAGSVPSFQAEVLSHPDVKKAMEIMRQREQTFPDDTPTFYWAMMKNSDAAEAQRAAENIRQTPRQLVAQSVQVLLTPISPGEAMDLYWMQQIYGEPANAGATLRSILDAGIPLPIQP